MRNYELTYILSPDLSDEQVAEATERVAQMIRARGGVDIQAERWGRRRLAYPIKHRLEGTYIVSQVALEPPQVAEVDHALNLSEEVLRHLLVLRPSKRAGEGDEHGQPE